MYNILFMSSKIQSILIPKNKFSLQRANSWITKHGFKLKFGTKPVHITTNYYRYRQASPSKSKTYRIKRLPDNVEIVVMF